MKRIGKTVSLVFWIPGLLIASVIMCQTCTFSSFRHEDRLNANEAVYRFGKGLSYDARYITDGELPDLKRDLKSALAFAGIASAKEEWARITDLSVRDGIYILFELAPETALPAPFLNFEFQYNGRPPLRVDSYLSAEDTRGDERVYTGAGFYGPMLLYGPNISIYPSACSCYRASGGERRYFYRYLLLFSRDTKKATGNLFVVGIPEVGKILFNAP